jgi:phosphate uptake regulator
MFHITRNMNSTTGVTTIEYRKLISFGKGGFVVSMPKSWIDEHQLQKGSSLALEKNGSSITLSPPKNITPQQKKETETTIFVDDKSENIILQMLNAAYLKSFASITLTGNKIGTMLPAIRRHAQKLIALEIVETGQNRVVMRDFLDFGAIPIADNVRKMDILVRSMFTDVCDPKNYTSVIERDDEVDRLFLVALKAIRQSTKDPSLVKKLNMTHAELFNHAANALSLEKMADELQRFAQECKDARLPKNIRIDLQKLIKEMHAAYLDTMKVLHKNDIPHSFTLSSREQEIKENVKAIQNKYTKQHPVPLLAELIARMAQINHEIVRRLGEQ